MEGWDAGYLYDFAVWVLGLGEATESGEKRDFSHEEHKGEDSNYIKGRRFLQISAGNYFLS